MPLIVIAYAALCGSATKTLPWRQAFSQPEN